MRSSLICLFDHVFNTTIKYVYLIVLIASGGCDYVGVAVVGYMVYWDRKIYKCDLFGTHLSILCIVQKTMTFSVKITFYRKRSHFVLGCF